ncbi:MAG: hypothetical protein NVSMB24_38870 [Mucilaginibacter sp.]
MLNNKRWPRLIQIEYIVPTFEYLFDKGCLSLIMIVQVAYMNDFGTPVTFACMFNANYSALPSQYLNSKRRDPKIRLEASGDE